jgi:hypothetical protein
MRRLLLLVPLVAALGCNQRKEELNQALADAQALAAEKDSLITEVLETSKFVNSINEELARARSAVVANSAATEGGTPAERDRAARAAALERVQALVARLNETETRLEQSTQRARSLSTRNTTLLRQIDEYRASIDSLQASALRTQQELESTIDQQRVQIATLSGQLDTARIQNETMAAERAVAMDSAVRLTDQLNTVYYVVGTEDELLEKGIVVKEGSKFLFFGGKQLHPARHLDPGLFTPLDRRAATTIDLPDDHQYKIVSRQNIDLLDSTFVKDGKVKDELRITDPEAFWAGSQYLILVAK